MKNKMNVSIIPFLMFLVVFAFVNYACAETVKERMKQRLPVLTEMKKAGVIGENNEGFLEYRSADRSNEEAVNGENDDRNKVYNAIARQQNTSMELVGKRRAKQIAEIATPGTWLQREDGSWYKK